MRTLAQRYNVYERKHLLSWKIKYNNFQIKAETLTNLFDLISNLIPTQA